MDYYVALIHKDEGSDYGVMFPDFPGCVTAGSSIEEAIQLAPEALALHVQGMIEDGEAVPAPRTVEQIKAAKEVWVDFDDASIAMTPLLPSIEGKPQATNLSLDPVLVQSVDRYAKKMNMTRSTAFAEGAKLLMAARPAPFGQTETVRIRKSKVRDAVEAALTPKGGNQLAGRLLKAAAGSGLTQRSAAKAPPSVKKKA